MKLYVWEGVLEDYTSGIMFALANTVEEAKTVIIQKYNRDYKVNHSHIEEVLENSPFQVYETPVGFYLYGGG